MFVSCGCEGSNSGDHAIVPELPAIRTEPRFPSNVRIADDPGGTQFQP